MIYRIYIFLCYSYNHVFFKWLVENRATQNRQTVVYPKTVPYALSRITFLLFYMRAHVRFSIFHFATN